MRRRYKIRALPHSQNPALINTEMPNSEPSAPKVTGQEDYFRITPSERLMTQKLYTALAGTFREQAFHMRRQEFLFLQTADVLKELQCHALLNPQSSYGPSLITKSMRQAQIIIFRPDFICHEFLMVIGVNGEIHNWHKRIVDRDRLQDFIFTEMLGYTTWAIENREVTNPAMLNSIATGVQVTLSSLDYVDRKAKAELLFKNGKDAFLAIYESEKKHGLKIKPSDLISRSGSFATSEFAGFPTVVDSSGFTTRIAPIRPQETRSSIGPGKDSSGNLSSS